MIVHDCEQGSPKWHELRCGIPTASQFHRLLTPKKTQMSAQSWGYFCECLAEELTGTVEDEESSQYMERGHKLELQALNWFAFDRSLIVRQVGFITDDERTMGCSPDGLIYSDGEPIAGLEIKVPKRATHVGYIERPETLVDKYRLQVQGGLAVTGFRLWYLLSYNPLIDVLPPVVVEVERDEECIARMKAAIAGFTEAMNEVLVRRGFREPPQLESSALELPAKATA
ncbi:MAG: YqaJ viral recombinase family protein [Betaproteobacteria bacterium]|nr:MAG: YqaJ viral recombinase family protein [Betaproteobacteria bacterium]